MASRLLLLLLLFFMCREVKVWRRLSSPARWLHGREAEGLASARFYLHGPTCLICPACRGRHLFLTGAGSDRLTVGGGGGEWFHRCWQTRYRGHSLSLVGRGFFSFVSVFFSFVLSKRLISVMSGLSDILAVRNEGRKKYEKRKSHLTLQAMTL